jgi:putative Flp pilus-assembly TadE/G-like protein
MRSRFQRLYGDERGISTMLVGFGFVGFMAASTLALDVGMNVTARTQAQSSADAGALAGAIALVFNDYNNRTPAGPAVTSAVNAALANRVAHKAVSVGPEDVTFPVGPAGQANRVRVFVDREVPTMLAWIFGRDTMLIRAAATAEASPANAANCLLPFTIPDRWQENTAGPWTPDSQFEMYDKRGNLLNPRDVYVKGANGTGYTPTRDKGTILVLKTDNANKVSPSIYNPWAIPGNVGASDYRDAISGCKTGTVATDYLMTPEPGNMTGPTRQGIQDLVAKDPDARWDTACNCIKGSKFPLSPRVRTIPLYDPFFYEEGKQNGRNASLKVVSFMGVFVIGMQGNEVVARIHPVTALVSGTPSPFSSFAMAIRLVE